MRAQRLVLRRSTSSVEEQPRSDLFDRFRRLDWPQQLPQGSLVVQPIEIVIIKVLRVRGKYLTQ